MFRWAVIGTGNIADKVVSEIVKSGRHSISAVYSRTKARAKAFADKYGGVCCDSLAECVAREDVDGVYIATPHSAHYFNMKEVIDAAKPVLCEKSFTVNAEQTKEIFNLAKQRGVFVAEAMWTRFNPNTRNIIKWVKDGEIGEIKSIKATFNVPLFFTRLFMSERVYKKEYAGGALLDLGVYPISYAQMLLGKPKKIVATAKLKDGIDLTDNITLIYEHAECKLGCSFKKMPRNNAVIVGTKGKIVVPEFFHASRAYLYRGAKCIETSCNPSGYIYQFDEVAKAIANKEAESEFIPHKDTIQVMEIMDSVRKQSDFMYPEFIEKL